jgi:hypothetical protein
LDNVEETIQALIDEVKNQQKEIKVLRGLYDKEQKARLAVAKELEDAQKTIARLNFYLENS